MMPIAPGEDRSTPRISRQIKVTVFPSAWELTHCSTHWAETPCDIDALHDPARQRVAPQQADRRLWDRLFQGAPTEDPVVLWYTREYTKIVAWKYAQGHTSLVW